MRSLQLKACVRGWPRVRRCRFCESCAGRVVPVWSQSSLASGLPMTRGVGGRFTGACVCMEKSIYHRVTFLSLSVSVSSTVGPGRRWPEGSLRRPALDTEHIFGTGFCLSACGGRTVTTMRAMGWPGEAAPDDLDRDQPAARRPREIDDAHPTRPEPAQQPVRPHRAWIVGPQRLHRPPFPRCRILVAVFVAAFWCTRLEGLRRIGECFERGHGRAWAWARS
jgi:hypothetical protein